MTVAAAAGSAPVVSAAVAVSTAGLQRGLSYTEVCKKQVAKTAVAARAGRRGTAAGPGNVSGEERRTEVPPHLAPPTGPTAAPSSSPPSSAGAPACSDAAAAGQLPLPAAYRTAWAVQQASSTSIPPSAAPPSPSPSSPASSAPAPLRPACSSTSSSSARSGASSSASASSLQQPQQLQRSPQLTLPAATASSSGWTFDDAAEQQDLQQLQRLEQSRLYRRRCVLFISNTIYNIWFSGDPRRVQV